MKNRMTKPDQDLITLSEAAAILGVSDATLRNWIKLSKVQAAQNSPVLFSKRAILSLHSELDDSKLLKSRRNKSRITSNFIPKSYINQSSPNYYTIVHFIEHLYTAGISFDCNALLASYARKFMDNRNIPSKIQESLLEDLYSEALNTSSSKAVSSLTADYGLSYNESEDTLGMLYLSIRTLKDKKATGSYYTPFYVSRHMIDDILSSADIKDKKILDPSCGSGNFLLHLPDNIPLSNIYGFDIDKTAVLLTRINLAIKYEVKTEAELKILKDNISIRDYLKSGLESSDDPKRFDIVLGNPPWGYRFERDTVKELSQNFSAFTGSKMPESFSLFIEQGLKTLADGGTLSFILPETVLEASVHHPIREYISEHSVVNSLTYLGEVFDKVQCPCIILKLSNTSCKEEKILVTFGRYKKDTFEISSSFYASPHRLRGTSFHILCDDDQFSLVNKIFSAEHFSLKDQATFALGIVSGANKELIKEKSGPGLEPVIRGKDVQKYRFSRSESFISYNPSVFQQCAPTHIYRAEEKLFYRFISSEPVFALDTDKTLSLNSANILIPHVPGYSIHYILALLNSGIISFYYKKSFRSLKVLRSNLEALPLAQCSDEMQKKVIVLSKKLSNNYSPELYLELDKIIASIYNITDDEYETIIGN